MSNNSYGQILDFIEKYGGNQYKKLSKCTPGAELEYMKNGSEVGGAASKAFKDIVEQISSSFALIYKKDKPQWQNSGTFVSYFWRQLKRVEYDHSNISISLFAEKGQEGLRLRASVELAVESADESDKKAYKKILDLPLKNGLTYISGGNNETEFKILDDRDNEVIKAASYKKVQISYIINRDQIQDDKEVIDSLSKGVSTLLEYYDYALSGNNIGSTGAEGGGTEEKIGEIPYPLSAKEIINQVNDYICKAGFSYEKGLVENFYLSLKTVMK